VTEVVVDASVAVAWCLGEPECREIADSVLATLASGLAVVPSIWPAEVANVLVAKERQKRLRPKETESLLRILGDLPVVVDDLEPGATFSRVAELARASRLSVYDALYLDLAIRKSIPLATLDQALRAASKSAGVRLHPA
jgi:predicted nucleic acid-binding protein